METKNLIFIEQLCAHHNIEFAFITSLHKLGLIEIVVIEERQYLSQEQLNEVEKMIRLHQELEINTEGIDAVYNLLNQIERLQRALVAAENRLRFFE
jgi:chaperone modulatory protein CbpM